MSPDQALNSYLKASFVAVERDKNNLKLSSSLLKYFVCLGKKGGEFLAGRAPVTAAPLQLIALGCLEWAGSNKSQR